MADEGGEEEKFALVEWRVDNFGCWNGDFHDKMISSPNLQVASEFSCTLELYPRGLSGVDEHLVLRVCYKLGLKAAGELTYVGPDDQLLCVQHKDLPVERLFGDRVVTIFPPGPKFHDVVDKIKKHVPWHKDSLTLRLRVKNVSRSVLRVRTKIKAIDTTLKIHRATFASSRDWVLGGILPPPLFVHIVDIPPFLSDTGTAEMGLEATSRSQTPDAIMKLKLKEVPKDRRGQSSFLNGFLVYTRLSVLDGEVITKSEDNHHAFVNERGWTFSQSLTRRELSKVGASLVLRLKIVPSKSYEQGTVLKFDPGRVDVVPTFRTERYFTCNRVRNENSVEVLTRELSRLYRDREFSDFRLTCEGIEFPVHKNLLCARSPVLKTMLQSNMIEAESGCMRVEDLDSSSLGLFLAFLYTGSVGEELQGESALKLYYAADKYEVPSLKSDCADFLSANVTNANVCDVLSFGNRYRDVQMYTAALDFVLKKYNAVLISKEWDVFMEREPELAAGIVGQITERGGM